MANITTGAFHSLKKKFYDNGDDSFSELVQAALPEGLDTTNDAVSAHEKGYTAVPLTASGQILPAAGRIKGFYVHSTTAGTVRVSDALTATTPYLGGAATPAVGWHEYPANVNTGAYVTITGTMDVTFFVRQGSTK